MTAEKDDKLTASEEARRAAALRKKKASGEKLSREEAGFLGAVESRRATAREAREAEEAGRGEAFKEAHRTASWMRGEATRAPEVTEADLRRERELREKRERGEKLTHEESGFLGGLTRAKEASGEE